MCHHREPEYTRLYEDEERADLPEWAIDDSDETDETEDEPEPFAPETAD